ncbi:protein FAM83B-like [Brachionichthys hirsutus]|uniref:protein FAM83B-like n=1 Tax=Brachionichthys hirsutus TaxID=412623 RepID=UPI00360467DD
MESSLSGLSSLKDDGEPVYVQPHYKEGYRLAIYALLCGGKEAYEEFLGEEQISHLLSDEEILFILENAESPVLEDDTDGKRPKDVAPQSTYFPTESDEEIPDLELGWPEVSLEGVDTSISLLFQPPRQNAPSIKDVVRKQVQEARQVIAIAMDVFTDFDIFKELIAATLRGVSVYILLDDDHFSSFLAMSHRVGVNLQDVKNLRVRTVQGQQYLCRSGMKFHGDLQQKFILIDCQTVIYGTYSYTWLFEKINLSMVLVVTGQLVGSYDEEFRRLYARSTVPVFQSRERDFSPPPRKPVALQSPSSSQLSLHQIHLKSRGLYGVRGAQNDRFGNAAMLSRGISVQEKLHQSHCPDVGNMVRGYSYGGELQKLNSMIRLRMANKDPGVAPERTGSNSRGVGDFLLPNRLSQQHLRHRTRYGADQNLIPFNSETSLHKWKMDTYLNDSDTPLDASCDAVSTVTSPYGSNTGLNEHQSQVIHSKSRDIKSRIEDMRQKRLSLQDQPSARQSQEYFRSLYLKERPAFKSPQKGPDTSGAELEPNGQNGCIREPTNHHEIELNQERVLTDGQRSVSYYDVKMLSDPKTTQDPLSRTTSAGELRVRSKDSSLKLPHLQSGGLNVQHPRLMESLREIPEEKEGSNTRVNTSGSAGFRVEREELSKKEKAGPKENSMKSQNQSRGSHGSRENVTKTSGSALRGGRRSTSNEVLTGPKDSAGAQYSVEAKRSHAEKEQIRYEEPTLQRKNSLRMKMYSLLTSDEKKASKKEEKSQQRKASMRTKNPSGSNQPVRVPPADRTTDDYRSSNICSGPAEPEKQRSPFSKLSPQRPSKRKTGLSAAQDRGSGSALDEDPAAQYQGQNAYSRYEYLLPPEHAPKDRGSSLNRLESGFPQTQSGSDNKLGRFMHRVGSFMSKNK